MKKEVRYFIYEVFLELFLTISYLRFDAMAYDLLLESNVCSKVTDIE